MHVLFLTPSLASPRGASCASCVAPRGPPSTAVSVVESIEEGLNDLGCTTARSADKEDLTEEGIN